MADDTKEGAIYPSSIKVQERRSKIRYWSGERSVAWGKAMRREVDMSFWMKEQGERDVVFCR